MIALLLAVLAAQAEPRFRETSEEFTGPFPSWKNVKTDFGAAGDGVADDSPAIQRALDALRDMPKSSWSTLYFPAGRYRLESTLLTSRKAHNDWLGCEFVGEDPETTVLEWHGPEGKWMWGLDAWYCKVSRLAFDGRGRAGAGLMRWHAFSTYCELSDLRFRDIPGAGIRLGSNTNHQEGQAEHAILRCRFKNCGTGILTSDWNTLDIYVWHSLFEDCGRGVHNDTGGWQAVGNVFLRSKEWDLGTSNNFVFNVLNNVSVGSKRFLGPFAARSFVAGNRVYDSLDAAAVTGKEVLLGNAIRSREGNAGPAVRLEAGSALLAENVYTVREPVSRAGPAIRRLGERVVGASDLPLPELTLPAAPANRRRKVFDVRPGTGDDAAEIQRRIDEAVAEPRGSNPVVHLPAGKYALKSTVTIPGGIPLQIVGDGASEHGSVLKWSGRGPGPGLRLLGPSRATLRDFCVNFTGSGADAVAVENADQPEGRLYFDQVVCAGNDASKRCDTAILIDGIEQADVTYRNGGWGEFRRAGVLVKGGPLRAAGKEAPGRITLLLGALGNNEYRLIDVRDGGRVAACGFRDETPRAGSLIDLGPESSGWVGIAGMSWAGTPSSDVPFVNLDGFRGTLAYVGNSMGRGYQENDGSFFFRIAGDGSRTNLLCAGSEFRSRKSVTLPAVWRDTSDPPADALLVSCVGGGVNEKSFGIPGVSGRSGAAELEDARLLAMMAELRDWRTEPPWPKPDGVTDLKVLRVFVRAAEGRTGISLRR